MTDTDSQPEQQGNMFGTFGGVFTPSILTILGAIMFLRANFVLGHAGILGAVLILALCNVVTSLTALSVSAVSTNMELRGGGAYFMISRVLGPEFGGAIGIGLYFAQALSVPFYILAFTEALTSTFPALRAYSLAIMLVSATILFVISYVGASWAIKTQYVIMAVLSISIVAFMGGGLRVFSVETFRQNMSSSGSAVYPFWIIFAIYFPAVTGILAGINMSGDLAEPAKSIPRGTFLAIGVGFAVYLLQIFVSGGAYARVDLIDRPYKVLETGALFGAGFLVAVGVTAATLSSALGSYLGAPRILQALARDRILPVIGFFAHGSKHRDEPRRGLVLTALVTFAVLIVAGRAGSRALNAVAAVITMFFLYTYGMINLAAFIEGLGRNPSFRPRFRFFHWATAMLGAVGCFGIALLISAPAALVAMALMALLHWYITRRELKASFGDARRGYFYTAVRRNLLRLSEMAEDKRNWRPTILVFSGNPNAREALVRYSDWLEGGRGIVYLANVLTGSIEEHAARRRAARRQLQDFCREKNVQAFPVVVVSEDIGHGVRMLLQSAALGPMSPNLAVFGWPSDPDSLGDYVSHLRIAADIGMSLVLLSIRDLPTLAGSKRIDIWWRGQRNGGLMVLLAHLLRQNREWLQADLRILRLVQSEAGRVPARESLQELIDTARVDATPRVVVEDRPFQEVMPEYSSAATCVFIGFELPAEDKMAGWFARENAIVRDVPNLIRVHSSGQEDVFA